jgi:hypothetical protein
MKITRRTFLGTSAASAAMTLTGGMTRDIFGTTQAVSAAGPGNKWQGRVAVNFNKNAITGTTTPNETVIKKMVDDAILLLTGAQTIGAAWKAVFPATLGLQSKIAVKINILNAGLPRPSEFSVMAITAGLVQMDFNGTKFPAANITIYDSNNSVTMDSAGYTAARFPGINRVKDSFQNFGDGARNLGYARTLNAAHFLINVFSPRGISSGNAEGFSLGFKSHYGTYENPGSYHGTASPAHLNAINCTGPVFNKTVLSICSGIFGMNEGTGPGGNAADYSRYSKSMDPNSTATSPTTIIMSTDPVSAEMQAIKMMRLNQNPTGKFSVTDMPNYLKAAGGIASTVTPSYTIGVIDESKMDIRRIINDAVATVPAQSRKSMTTGYVHAEQLHGRGFSIITYALPPGSAARTVEIDIIDCKGAIVFTGAQAVSGRVNQFPWDECDERGSAVMAGRYFTRVRAGTTLMTHRFVIVR